MQFRSLIVSFASSSMAAQSPPWGTTTNSFVGFSSFITTSKLCIFSGHFLTKFSKRGTRFVRFSLDEPVKSRRCDSRTSPSLAVLKSSENNFISKRVVTPGQVSNSADSSFFIIGEEDKDENMAKNGRLHCRFLSCWSNSWVAKKPLWKSFFLASNKVRSIILLNILTIIYASNIPVVKEVEAVMDPALFSVVRFAVSALPFLPFMIRTYRDAETRNAGLELGFWISLGYLTQALGLLTSDAGRASFISSFTVVVVPFIDGILGARIPFLTWSGAITSLVGIGMIESSGSPPTIGDFLNFLSAVTFGIHMLRTEHYSRTTKKEKFLALLGYEVWVVALSSAIWCVVKNGLLDTHQMHSISWASLWNSFLAFPWVAALYTGIFSTGLCLWAEMTAMQDVSATEAAIIYGLEPLWGAAFAWFMLQERWGATGWFGAILILGGSLTVQLFGSSPEKPMKNEENSNHLEDSNIIDGGAKFASSKMIVNSRKKTTKLKE
ncbi:putative transporter [Nymphaea thermarum]|nr:putative transporter [Nymphaea thermarum]